MALTQWLPRLRSALANKRLSPSFLDADAFEHAAMCERMRVDRNGSVLAILLIRLPEHAKSKAKQLQLGALLDDRLRVTDTAGLLSDGRFGVLLPDTPGTGAWKVAQDLGDLLEDGEQRPTFEVMVYPDDSAYPGWDVSPPEVQRPVDAPADSPEGIVACRAGDFESLFSKADPLWKRATDVVVGSLGLTIAAPVVAACAGAVMLTSRGAPFFVQEREGLGGRRFKMYKIRTMRVDAEAQKAALREHSEQDGPAFKMTRDPRVTRIGRVLRALSLDELPQLLNVVRGEMSLVGPRPLPVEESLGCKPWQRQRLRVKPGITCIWQVHGRNTVAFDDWVRMDLEYIKRRSPLHDMRLLIETGPSLIFSRGPR